MRRVVAITTSYPAFEGDPSGHFVQTEARELAHEAKVIVVTAGIRGGVTEDDGIRVIRLEGGDAFGWPGVAVRLREDPRRVVSVWRWVKQARETLRRLEPLDHVVAHWAVPCALPVADAIDAPIEVVSHGGDIRLLTRLPARARSAIVGRLLDRIVRWRFVSESLREELISSLWPAQRANVLARSEVRPAVITFSDVTARSRELRREALASEPGMLWVCVGRLVASKRFDRALEYVARQAPERASSRLVVVGDGPERSRLEARARGLGLDARFVGLATRGEALAWIGAADALLHASVAEGFSTVVREAHALGVSVVGVE